MRKVIEDTILGKQTEHRPKLQLPDLPLRLQLTEGECCKGSFFLESCDVQKVRGIVTSSCPFLTLSGTQFDNTRMEIFYEYRNPGLLEGQEADGEIVVTSTAGEVLLPFVVTVTRIYLRSSIGKIKTLNDFTNLAKLNWEEALKIFQSPHFANIFHEEEAYYRLLYQALTSQTASSHEMEEFLIAAGKKKRNHYRAEKDLFSCTAGADVVSDKITIQKDEWGFLELRAQCDAPFIRLERAGLGMHDFIGKHADLAFHILPDQMHAGKNYAQITLDSGYEKKQITLIVSANAAGHADPVRKKRRQMKYFLIRNYVGFRLGKMEQKEWLEKSAALLRELEKGERPNPWVYLFLSYLMWENEEQENSQRMMELYLRNPGTTRSPEHAFYLYLEILRSEDAGERRDLTVKIREIFMRYQNHPVLAWILLQSDEALQRNAERKYHMVKKFATEYSVSPVFYCEASELLKEHPEFLHKQDVFELRVLYWMAKNQLLTEAIALRVLDFSRTRKQFDRRFFFLLIRCHKLLNCDQSIKGICAYLIKLNCFGTEFFQWFANGIARHLKIAGLYEAYMMSWNKADGEIPREVLKYFSMNKSLPAKRKAMLFAYVVRNRARMGADWEPYMVMVRNFAHAELEKGAMNEDLAVIYEEVKKLLPPAEWDKWKNHAESVYRLFVPDRSLHNIQIFQAGDLPVQRVAAHEGSAYISLIRKPFVILYEDRQGRLYESKDTFRLKKMISGPHIYAQQSSESAVTDEKKEENRTEMLQKSLDAFAGSIAEMYDKIRQAEALGIDVHMANRRLLERMLFSGTFLGDHESVFAKLGTESGDRIIRSAYIAYFARRAVFEKKSMPVVAADALKEAMTAGTPVNKYCELAFLQNWCMKPKKESQTVAETILKKYLLAGNYFACYQDLPMDLQRRYFLYDQITFQFALEPGRIYRFSWTDGKSGNCEHLRECLPGIYSVAFSCPPGTTVSGSVLDENGTEIIHQTRQKPDCPDAVRESRYAYLQTKTAQQIREQDAQIEEVFQLTEE